MRIKEYDDIFSDPRMTKSKRRKIINTYKWMKRRTDGKIARCLQYKGLFLCDKIEFYKWTQSNDDFHNQYDFWLENGKQRRFAPSISKEDQGYALGTIQWLPFGEHASLDNSRREWTEEHSKRRSESIKGRKHSPETKELMSSQRRDSSWKARLVMNKDTGEVYPTISTAARDYGINRSTLVAQLNERIKNKTNLIFVNKV